MNVLSFSSHVVHGTVGNRAIQFPLNLRGWNVDCINTTNLSNHPGFRTFKGSKTDAATIADIFEGLVEIGLEYDAVIVGYVASVPNLECIADILAKLSHKPLVVLDPILGDNDKLYVDQNLIPVYKRILKDPAGLVTLTTPNQFEMETLTDTKISDWDSLTASVTRFYDLYNVQYVVITSVSLDGAMYCVGCLDPERTFAVPVDQVPAVFSGSGDLFLGLLTDIFHRTRNLETSLKHTVDVVQRVLKRTLELTDAKMSIGSMPYIPSLKLVESKDIIE
ncbi:hypothetical protein KL905_002161 [Ogataea polymorpha]|uniref:pyridoxal kinase n=1 Tax=Ogataea polymorpha TaxID=460523 RepID=A0A1B7SCP6_9ASCO|nr:uncharacterized protein OGAPODRAFT_17110 [Ogataea polymorpha]KAG7880973.1 hypothetical protein KL937_001820 [Ogataea polymorpha]KAG7889883.1 hypothetical protein KL936_002557 [Ogataea polymorpha]KAG7893711.1 hypothetical protein KL908_002765 [Ogataea polymorpha]KAG7901334.1 hypothetical protein KL935_002400 [Ogataea polymorpha]KAG7905687.1 hypothetical protein KL907_002834 [Ogataea polymorpha]